MVYWSAKQAAAYINVHPQTLYEWIKQAEQKRRQKKKKEIRQLCKLVGPSPPFRRFGRNCIRFPINEFKAWAMPLSNPGQI